MTTPSRLLLLLLVSSLATSRVAAAQAGGAPPERSWGVGTALGGGYVAAVAGVNGVGSASAGGAGIELPTLELRFFLPSGHSIDVSTWVANTIVLGAAAKIFYWNSSAFYNFNLGSGRVRGLLAPGIGFEVAAAPGVSAGALQIPAIVGVEFLTEGRHFGFSIRARPFFEVGGGTVTATSAGSTASSSANLIGGGVLGELVFMGYGTR